MIIGIDLGTTNSVVAYMSDDGPRLIPNALGEVLTPSVVGLEESGDLLVGRTAKEFQVLEPDRCASLFKRHMGTDWKRDLGGRRFTPEELSSFVLRSLKQDAEAHLGRPISQAVITVPAYFNDNQRQATIRAGELAGLKVERILNEPTAASIAYGLHEAGAEKTIVVFDLGGGTFDISVVALFEGMVEVRSSSGECFLGGEDFTKTLAARVLETQGMMFERTELESPALVARLIQQCERAKCQLARQESVTIRVPNREGELTDVAAQVVVSRDQFEKWTESILARVELPIRRGLGDASLTRQDVDEVILVGGATRMPAVVRRVEEIFQRRPHCRLNPDEVVALGAAVQAGLLARNEQLNDLVVTDVAPFTLGIDICKQIGMDVRDGYFLPIINRNTTIPVSRVRRVETVTPNQTNVRVRVYQGEGRRAHDNLLLGELDVAGIPRGPAGQEVDIRFTYDLNGVLEVEATVVKTKKTERLVITKHAQGLSGRALQQAVEQLARLKVQPREEARYRFLIKRAERLYQELPMAERERLMELLDGLEGALSFQDKGALEQHRQELEVFLSCYDPDLHNDEEFGE